MNDQTMAQRGWLSAHVEQLADFYHHRLWVDLVKTARAFAPVGTGMDVDVPVDKNGWPKGPCTMVLSSGNYADLGSAQVEAGDVCLGRVDSLTDVVPFYGCTITDVAIDGAYKTFTLTVTGNPVAISTTFAIPLGISVRRQGPGIDDTTVWNPEAIAYLAQFGGLRAMKLLGTENAPPRCPPSRWADRPTRAAKRCGFLYTGMIWEDLIDLANTLYFAPGSNFKRLGVNFHHLQNVEPLTDYWEGAFTLLKSTLYPMIVIEPEQSNEIWNFGYACQGYYMALGRQQMIANNVSGGLKQVASVSRVGGIAAMQTIDPHNLVSGMTVNVGVSGSPNFNATRASVTVTNPNTFSYPSPGVDSSLAVIPGGGADNVVINPYPGLGLDFDNAASLPVYRNRAYARDVRRMAMVAEQVFGTGALGNRIKVVLANQQGSFDNMASYLQAVYNDRPVASYIHYASFGGYLQPAGTTRDAILASLDDQLYNRVVPWAKSWVQQCAHYGLHPAMYEWGLDFRAVPNTQTIQDLQADPALAQKVTAFGQAMIDLGVENGYFHIVTPNRKLGNGFNICRALNDTSSPKLQGLLALRDVVPRAISAFNVAPGVCSTTARPGRAQSVYDVDPYGASPVSPSTGWSINGGHFGLQGSNIAQQRWFRAKVLMLATRVYSLNLKTCCSARGKVWQVQIDDQPPVRYPVAQSVMVHGYYDTPQAYNQPINLGVLTEGYHSIKVTTHTIGPADQIGCDEYMLS